MAQTSATTNLLLEKRTPFDSQNQPPLLPVDTLPCKKSLYRRFKIFFSRIFKRKQKLQQFEKLQPFEPFEARTVVRKPVIYVFSPTEIDVSVSVTLEEDVHFTAIYPVVPVQRLDSHREKIQWDVHTASDGTLLERAAGLELSYLFWEADLNTRNSMLSGQGTAEPNTVPEMWTLTDSNSVVVSVHEITNYLERVLGCLGLHTEARTSFITFWLPSFLEHGFIALRFLPQAEYSRIAHLDIEPAPDVITRIFMLFQGVKDPKAWPLAQKRALDDVSKWTEIVGVNSSAVFNKDLSRVLEWGAMEIPS